MLSRSLKVIVLIAVALVAVVAIAIAAKSLTGGKYKSEQAAATAPEKRAGKQLWTCGMHPQVVQDHPGTCPICHMRLVPMRSDGAGDGATAKGERKVLYWWDPMLGPNSISDKPGK